MQRHFKINLFLYEEAYFGALKTAKIGYFKHKKKY